MRNKSSFRDRNGNNVIDYPEILDLKWVIKFIAGLKKKKILFYRAPLHSTLVGNLVYQASAIGLFMHYS